MPSTLQNRFKKVLDYFTRGNERNQSIKKNIFLSFFIRGGSILTSLLLVPVTIQYVGNVQYGLWITISSIIAWMSTFDLGMGNGLRNKLAHALAMNDHSNSSKYVSTTYAILFMIALGIFGLVYTAGIWIDWASIINAPEVYRDLVWPAVLIILICFCLQFFLQTINTVLTATHQPYKTNLITLLGQLLSLICIYVLSLQGPGNLITAVLVLAGLPVVVLFLANMYYFATLLKSFAPKIQHVEMGHGKDLFNLGGIFFLIQIGALALYQTDNIIITNILGPEYVTEFNVAYKYYTAGFTIFTIILTPYWSAFTDAYAKQDYAWMRATINMLRKMGLGFVLLSVLLLAVSGKVFEIWVGDAVSVSWALSISFACYYMVYVWHVIHIVLINGVGKLRMQLITIVVSAVINIPLSICLGKMYGLPGVISANTAIFLVMSILFGIQSEKIINQSAVGIWNK
ncbi:lipopolysaccharide biosynthesis protein [Pararhodonellum marinum]|uniref:lipopolysaccharide biosynthesis protein n=1 Tax=Pararhodonellum marinum TaxID=2755358 RepID=UPI00188E219F|nr:oligosaccharide flippase family protein [Pararhodonellum marinum]